MLCMGGMAWGQGVPRQDGKIVSPGGYDTLAAIIAGAGSVRVIVGVDAPFEPAATPSSAAARSQAGRIAAAQDALLADISASRPKASHKYSHVPYIFMEVNEAALTGLLASPRARTVYLDKAHRPTLDLSIPRIGAPSVWASGYTGSGITVAVIDTGVDKGHPFLSGSVVSEACYSSDDGLNLQSLCPGGLTESTADGSAMPYAGACPAGACDHGTHVAGIIAGRPGVSGSIPFGGVAPAAGIIAIQVFALDSLYGVVAYDSDIIRGLERVYALSPSYTISSVNMSLGGGRYFDAGSCDAGEGPTKAAIDQLRAAGIATVVSSGNDGYCGSMSAPGCISTAVSVGATTDADSVAGYSNSATFVSLLAPGSSINSSVPGGTYESWDGTSMAAPHVTGAWALLKQATPGCPVDQILSALTSTGLSVTDSKCGTVTKQRINVSQALDLFNGRPLIQTNAASSIGAAGATLNGLINANNTTASVSFEYGYTREYGNIATVPGTFTGSSNTAVSAAITGLTSNRLYHFRAKATDGVTTGYGADMTFATTGPCGSIADGSFELGKEGPWLQASTNFETPLCDSACGAGYPRTGLWWAWFGGWTGIEEGSLEQAVTVPSGMTPRLEFYLNIDYSGDAGDDFFRVLLDGSEIIKILQGDTLYSGGYVRASLDLSAYADDGSHTLRFDSRTAGTSNSSFFLDDVSMSCVVGSVPAVTTGAASLTPPTGATLTGTVNPYGESTVSVFEYGTAMDYGNTSSAAESPVTGNSPTSVSAAISGLSAGITYHYRLRGQHAQGISYGTDMTFTLSCIAPAARINGSLPDKTLQQALNDATDTDLIWLNTAAPFSEGGLLLAGLAPEATVTIRGGYRCDFTPGSSLTEVNGCLTIGTYRTAVIDGIILK